MRFQMSVEKETQAEYRTLLWECRNRSFGVSWGIGNDLDDLWSKDGVSRLIWTDKRIFPESVVRAIFIGRHAFAFIRGNHFL